MIVLVTFSPFDGVKGVRGSFRKGLGDTHCISTTQFRVHGEDGKFWKRKKDLGDFLLFGILFGCQMLNPRVPHRKVDAPDIMTKPRTCFAPGRFTKSVPSSGDPTGGTEKNRAVEQRGCDFVPRLADENEVTSGD